MIKFTGVLKQFKSDETIAYDDYMFESGKSYVILGASGSGKSTLLNMIAGITPPTKGEIAIDGVPVDDTLRTTKIGYIYQDFKLIDDMTVEDNIRILEISKVKTQNLEEIAKKLEISDKMHRKVRTLSGGEKQRVAVARALVKRPDIILADEPTGSLNYEIGEKLMEKLMETAKGKILICVTHDTRLAKYFDHTIDLTAKGGEENV